MSNVENSSVLKFPVMFQKVSEYKNEDTRFTNVKIWLMHLGENFNGSFFEKDVVDNAIPTLSYIPIVGFIENDNENTEDFSDHRYIITKDSNGTKRKYMGVAYGVIKSFEENNAHYEERLCDDGETRTFLVVDGLIWNMFEDSSNIINNDLIKSQSMELLDDDDYIDGYVDDNNVFHFTKFSFRASCILGDSYEPAMQNSTIEVQFTMKDFIKDIQSELNNKVTTFTKLVNENINKGGIENMPKTAKTDFAQTVMEQFENISNMVSQYETVTDKWGEEVPRYYLRDIQNNEVIVVDRKESYHIYGFPFTLNGDDVTIDFSCGNRKKTVYESFDAGTTVEENIEDENNDGETNTEPDKESDMGFDYGEHIESIEQSAFDKVSEIESKLEATEKEKVDIESQYENIKNEYDELKPKYDNYVKLEQERIEKEENDKKDTEFSKYENALSGDEDFEELKGKKEEMTLSEIETECAVLFAKKNLTGANFNRSDNSNLSCGIIDNNDEDGYVVTKYGNIPVRR